MKPDIKDIAWNVDESTYRQDPALSYSTLARFAREGFNKLDSLFEQIETPSLTFGSAVDALITGGQDEFNNTFFVADFPAIGDSVLKMVKELFLRYNEVYGSLDDIPTHIFVELSEEMKYQLNWKPETRAKVIKEQGSQYYDIMYAAKGKKIISVDTKNKVDATVRALKESDSTKQFFSSNNPFDDSIERVYQAKFKCTFDNIEYRCMADLLYIDHANKVIYPIDLKTTGHPEWDFYQSFITWRYDIQARLYWRIIRECMNSHPIFKDYLLKNYIFVVVNKDTLTPLKWEFHATKEMGTLAYGKHLDIKLEDPFELGKNLTFYLKEQPKVPLDIKQNDNNNLIDWINREI